MPRPAVLAGDSRIDQTAGQTDSQERTLSQIGRDIAATFVAEAEGAQHLQVRPSGLQLSQELRRLIAMNLDRSQLALGGGFEHVFDRMIDEQPNGFDVRRQRLDDRGCRRAIGRSQALREEVQTDRIGPELGNRRRCCDVTDAADFDPHSDSEQGSGSADFRFGGGQRALCKDRHSAKSEI